MRYLHLIDKDAPGWVVPLMDDLSSFYDRMTSINMRHDFLVWDYSSYPKEVYYGEYEGMSRSWMANIVKQMYYRYGYSIDRVNFFVAAENWNLANVWGWNMGVPMSGYDVHQCRIETRENRTLFSRNANTLATVYHEGMHANPHTIKRYLPFDWTVEQEVNRIVKLSRPLVNWHDEAVHGNHPDLDYIRNTDSNEEILKAISRLLIHAFIERRRKENIDDLPAIRQLLFRIQEVINHAQEGVDRLRKDPQVMRPLTLEQEEMAMNEYQKIVMSKCGT